jgi:hypothetical protein
MNPKAELKAVAFGVLVAWFLVSILVGLGRKDQRRRSVAFLAAWLVPGAGHAIMGKWRKGLFFLAILGATYLAGLAIVGFRSVSFDDNPFYYVGQYGSGATFLLHRLLSEEKAFPLERLHPSWFDPGLLYVCVVGLLNLVVTLNVLDIKVAAPAGGAPSAPAPAPEKAS